MKNPHTKNFLKLLVAVGISELAGVAGSAFTVPAVSGGQGWYAGLAKPALTPPAWVFGPVWTALFLLMGIALFLVWNRYPLIRAEKRERQIWRIGVELFILQLALNVFWSVLFFGARDPGAAFTEIVFLWLAILLTALVFYRFSRPAAYLLVPYLLWVGFAAYLNYCIAWGGLM